MVKLLKDSKHSYSEAYITGHNIGLQAIIEKLNLSDYGKLNAIRALNASFIILKGMANGEIPILPDDGNPFMYDQRRMHGYHKAFTLYAKEFIGTPEYEELIQSYPEKKPDDIDQSDYIRGKLDGYVEILEFMLQVHKDYKEIWQNDLRNIGTSHSRQKFMLDPTNIAFKNFIEIMRRLISEYKDFKTNGIINAEQISKSYLLGKIDSFKQCNKISEETFKDSLTFMVHDFGVSELEEQLAQLEQKNNTP